MKPDIIGNTALQMTAPDYKAIQPNISSLGPVESSKGSPIEEFQAKPVSERLVQKAEREINKALSGSNTRVEFTVYKPTREVMIKIKDNETGKVIKEIPSKKELEMAAYMKKLAGIIVDEKV